MRIIQGSAEVPVIYTAHHASHEFGAFADRVALTAEQRLRFSDYGTDLTVPQNGIASLIAESSRALGDLNRDPDDPERFQDQDYGRPQRNNIWLPGQGLSDGEKAYCQQQFYEPFHAAIVDQLRGRQAPTWVVAWDNTADYVVGSNNAGQPVKMPWIVLSSRGCEERSTATDQEPTSCEPQFLEQLKTHFAAELQQNNMPNDIRLNLVMRGGYICRRYSSLRNQQALQDLGISCPVQSLQVEYNTALTHDQTTLALIPGRAEALRQAFSRAIQATIDQALLA